MEKADYKKSNRRRAFRIYEQVNLFYHQIDPIQEGESSPEFKNLIDSGVKYQESSNNASEAVSSFESELPDSHSQENDSLNVNISSSGLSFTSKDELKAGDYLMIRMFLLSSHSVVMACCKVVYSRPSNPYEENRYPYLVGVEFVNLQQEAKELLDSHVKKKRSRRLFVNGLLSIFVISILAMPDLAYELLLGVFDFVFEYFVETVHLAHELFEYNLDHLIEHFFHTGLQETQTIVFYMQIIFLLVFLYAVLRKVPAACRHFLSYCRKFYHRKKSSLLYLWGEQSMWYKIGLVGGGWWLTIFYCMFFI